MSDRTEYFRHYMRQYRDRLRAQMGITINPGRGRPRMTERVSHPAPQIMEAPGWPTKQQLMARR
jgi:hypothetical protein